MKEPGRIVSDGLYGTGDLLGKIMDDWREKIIESINSVGSNGIRVSRGASGLIVSEKKQENRFLRLSGNASPYSGDEVFPGTGGSWVLKPNGVHVDIIHEVNSANNLDLKVVRAFRNQFGWFCIYDRDGDTNCVRTFCVFASDGVTGGGVEGVTFHISGPSEIERECTTDETGECCFDNLPPGIYEITQIAGPEGYTLAEDPVYYELVCDVSIPGCACTSSPPSIHLTRDRPDSLSNLILPCTLQWTDIPASLLPLGLPPKGYLSTQQLQDQLTGDMYWNYLYCVINNYTLTRLYETSVYGSPYRDVQRFRWPIGQGTNTCQPFFMNQGFIYSGGDPACVVTIQG